MFYLLMRIDFEKSAKKGHEYWYERRRTRTRTRKNPKLKAWRKTTVCMFYLRCSHNPPAPFSVPWHAMLPWWWLATCKRRLHALLRKCFVLFGWFSWGNGNQQLMLFFFCSAIFWILNRVIPFNGFGSSTSLKH